MIYEGSLLFKNLFLVIVFLCKKLTNIVSLPLSSST